MRGKRKGKMRGNRHDMKKRKGKESGCADDRLEKGRKAKWTDMGEGGKRGEARRGEHARNGKGNRGEGDERRENEKEG